MTKWVWMMCDRFKYGKIFSNDFQEIMISREFCLRSYLCEKKYPLFQEK